MVDEHYSVRTWEFVEMGPEKALPLLHRLAEAGDAIAQYSLQFMYGKGEGLHCDTRLANYWLEELTKLAEAGDGQAQFILYEMYFCGAAYEQWVQQNTERGVHWLRKAAESGVAPAQYNLSLRYRHGEPPWFEQDLVKAEWLLRAAVAQGHPEAIYYSALMLLDADGIPRGEARRLLTVAAEKGIPPAAELLKRVQE